MQVNKRLFVFLSLICLLLQGSQPRTQKGREKRIFLALQAFHHLPEPGIPILEPQFLSLQCLLNISVVITIILSQRLFLFPAQDTCLVSHV